ncbi:uncharacterized protein BDZ99DRAFT_550633 [Mytilinidion resinicola]|uniref:Uncharacterized protein n=1 Tax=Mytilinidion resinicola TaxID=574789 RepID=A0A6A6Y1P8_9PEZI|nr:uncharacterized protein BDZ99DRAFT_550633 [Mytilinidion resinicola]KAF2802741.1 hypothetical protein BDZ99DRAFT_550633 [Mytilinidion resinicola]
MAEIEKPADARASTTASPASVAPGDTKTEGFPFEQPKLAINIQPVVDPDARRQYSWKNGVSVIIGILWLAPALTLLVLNFKGHIVGAGIGCRASGCRIDPYSTNQVQQTQKLDKSNHDALGALQLVAKALEVWFMFVAGNLVYNIAVRLANKDKLPMSLLTMYLEFMDIMYLTELFSKIYHIIKEREGDGTLPATTSNAMLGNTTASIAAIIHATEEAQAAEETSAIDPKEARRYRHILYWFLAGVAVLCIAANLMGPATAILVLPTLQWKDINQQDNVAFGALKASFSPSDETIAAECTADILAAGNYSCTLTLYSTSLDELVAGAISSNRQSSSRRALVIPPISQENNLTFSLNISKSSPTIWVPNRQALRDFSVDLTNFYSATTTGDFDPAYADSRLFNQSLAAQLQRKGPTVGMANDCALGNIRNFSLSNTKSIYCFPRAKDDKCIRWGPGWADTQNSAQFVIRDSSPKKANLTVTVYATTQAAYLVNDPCVQDGSCDWDAVFAATPSPEYRNISSGQLSFQYSMPSYSNLTVICDSSSYLSFANYVLNPSPLANILSLVELDVLDDSPSGPPDYSTPAIIDVHPDWLLAAWGANRGGAVAGDRGAAIQFIQAIQDWIFYGEVTTHQYAIDFNSIHQYTIVQALSMITYSTTPLASSADRRAQSQKLKDNPKTAATLNSWATVQLWAFGIDSRTSKLGITIILIGCICVIARTALYFDESKSPLEIVVAALQHDPPPEQVDKDTGAPVRVVYNRRTSSFIFPSPSSPPGSPMRSP